MNVILATGNKHIDTFISNMREINVLTSIKTIEKIIDTVIERNPHCIILSTDLTDNSSNFEFKEIIKTLKQLKPNLKIVFLYGEKDGEEKAFCDFLIQQKVYDFIIGSIDEYNLTNLILENATIEDVKPYILNQEEREKIIKESLEEEQQKIKEPVTNSPVKKLEVLIVEKLIEKEVINTQYIGNYKIGIGSLFNRSGCTHTTIELGLFLTSKKLDVAIVISQDDFDKIKSYYMLTDNRIENLYLYSDVGLALNHKIVIFDFGKLNDENISLFYEQNLKLLITPTSALEIDTLTKFVTDNVYAPQISFCFYPISDNSFKELRSNLKKGNCNGYKLAYNPCFIDKNSENQKTFDNICKDIIKTFKMEKKQQKQEFLNFIKK